MHDPSRVRVSGPLEAFASGFAEELARLGYRRTPATFQLQLAAHASRLLQREGLGADGLTSEVVERFLAERRAAGYMNYVTAWAMAPLLSYRDLLLRAVPLAVELRHEPTLAARHGDELVRTCRRCSALGYGNAAEDIVVGVVLEDEGPVEPPRLTAMAMMHVPGSRWASDGPGRA